MKTTVLPNIDIWLFDKQTAALANKEHAGSCLGWMSRYSWGFQDGRELE